MTVFSGSTHPGKIRSQNEDVIGWDTEHQIWLVADGMGGHAHGEVASQLVKEVVLRKVAEGSNLSDSILDAHQVITTTAAENSQYQGMGSTIVALEIAERGARLVWVGDSRAYLWRGSELEALSRDHSYLERLLAADHITEAEARHHPKRNIVTQILGVGEARPDETRVSLQADDWLILCSDGLNDELTDEEIAQQLKLSSDTETAVEYLIEAALSQGGRDNISVVVVQYDGESSVPAPALAAEYTDEGESYSGFLPLLLGGAAAALFAGLLWWLK